MLFTANPRTREQLRAWSATLWRLAGDRPGTYALIRDRRGRRECMRGCKKEWPTKREASRSRTERKAPGPLNRRLTLLQQRDVGIGSRHDGALRDATEVAGALPSIG